MPSDHGHRRECGPSSYFLYHRPWHVGLGVAGKTYECPAWGRHLSYQRGKRVTNPNTSLIKLEGVEDSKAANFYLGKKVAFVYRAKREVQGSKIRVIWGKVTRTHGNSGVVRAQFRHNLPPKSFGASVRVMLYPSSI
ncbi:60S ribosomal protein L33-A [Emergomyces pasteurianus Ep9510]|uniref:60S ribosomal protein L33-A n=1 Tax=Emergomyces pasteurianus Ep9510 TaxID=1447872 RepID=A0A1J9Q1R5_9EURO|nr:60S ribosomal protein L33-A [Emergomyces pasteurianus Ep9510]